MQCMQVHTFHACLTGDDVSSSSEEDAQCFCYVKPKRVSKSLDFLKLWQGTTRRLKAGDEVHCMLAVKKLLKAAELDRNVKLEDEERRHLDVKIACKVNTGSQQIQCARPKT